MSALATPGDVGVADVSVFRDGYAVARVVKANDLGKMWSIEILGKDWDGVLAWSQPKKRKVTRWLPIDETYAYQIRDNLYAQYDILRINEKELLERYHAEVLMLAGRYRP